MSATITFSGAAVSGTAGNAVVTIASDGTAPNFQSLGQAGIPVAPLGFAIPSLAIVSAQAATVNTNLFEMAANFSLASDTSYGQTQEFGGTSIPASKIALFTSVSGLSGTCNLWCYNSVLVMNSGVASDVEGQGMEIDVNNSAGDRGTGAANGFGPVVVSGLTISGGGNNRSTAALWVTGAVNTQWQRGFMADYGLVEVSFADYCSNINGMEMIGGKSGFGIDLVGSTFGLGAIRLPNSAPLIGLSASGTVNYPLLQINSGNSCVLGEGAPAIVAGSGIFPITNDTYYLGEPGALWAAVYSATGTIQTSDPSLKTEVAPLPSMLDLIMKINPITFKFKVGGYDLVESEEEHLVQDTEIVTDPRGRVSMVNGKAVRSSVKHTHVRELYDQVPVYDEQGNQLFDQIPEKFKGKEGYTGYDPRGCPVVHSVPRMVKKTVKVTKRVERAGRRTHWGFDAANIKAAFDGINMDFGGYVKGADDLLYTRPDQLVPVLMKAVQELTAKVVALEAAVASKSSS